MTLFDSKVIPFTHPFLIKPLVEFDDPHAYFLNAVQAAVDAIIPESFWLEVKSSPDPENLYYRLASLLPIFRHTDPEEESPSMTLTYLCPGEYTLPVRRYVSDTLSKWLVPGKQVEIGAGISLRFRFIQDPAHNFFIAQEIVSIRNREENLAIRKNIPDLVVELKQKFPCDFIRQAENNVHPIFMPRNEEEMLRNLIILSNQIKYVRDFPQVSIHYEKQNEAHLTFAVIIARLLRKDVEPLRKVLEKSQLKMDIDDLRLMGHVKQKYAKESAILRVSVDKRPFFRRDASLDLLKARQKIVCELMHLLGEFRDFNGGMILKQEEALKQLKVEAGKLSQQEEFLLENYFYSLKPAVMQTVYDSIVLKKHFDLLSAVLKSDLKLQPYQIRGEPCGKFFLCFIAATSPTFKEGLLNAIATLEISSRDLTTSFLEQEDTTAMGFILRMEPPEIAQRFQSAISEAFQEWSHRFYCSLSGR